MVDSLIDGGEEGHLCRLTSGGVDRFLERLFDTVDLVAIVMWKAYVLSTYPL